MAMLALAGLGCVPRLPDAEPTRVLERERTIEVVVVSPTPGVAVYDVMTEALLGRTPVTIDRMRLSKEIWKHSEGRLPPPAPADDVLERAYDAGDGPSRRSSTHGEPLRWTVLLGTGASRRTVVLELPLTSLESGFSDGRLELRLPAAEYKL